MDRGDVSNIMADSALRSAHSCSRCIAYFATGQHRYAGKVGCCFPAVTEGNAELFKAWLYEVTSGEDVQTMRCWRCFLDNSECFALPEALEEQEQLVDTYLTTIASPTATNDNKTVAEAHLTKRCVKMAQRLSKDKDFQPHAEKLYLHSGALLVFEPARTDAQPSGRKRDKATQQAKAESQKRKLEEKINEMVQTPTKKARGSVAGGAKRSLIAQAENLVLEIEGLKEERAGIRGRGKGALTKRINQKEKDRDALLAEAAKL